MSGKVNNRPDLKVVKGGPKGPEKKMPTPQDVSTLAAQVAREVVAGLVGSVQRETSEIVKVLSDKIAILFAEEVKTAVMVNSMAELLIEKGVFTKDDFKKRVEKNTAEAQKNYERVTEAMIAQQAAGETDADGRKQEMGGEHLHRPGEGGPAQADGSGPGLPPQKP